MKPTKESADALDSAIDALLSNKGLENSMGSQAEAAISPDTAHVVQNLHALAEVTPMRDAFMSELETQLLQEAQASNAASVSNAAPHSPASESAVSNQATSAGWKERVARSWRVFTGSGQSTQASRTAKPNVSVATPSTQISAARSGRVFSPAFVVVGMALVVAFFISISALLQARRDITDTDPVARAGTGTATILTPGGTTATTPQSDLEFVNALEPLVKIGADLIDKDNRGNTNIAWNPDGSSLAAASVGNNITIWDAATGKLSRTIETGHKERLAGLAWSPDGTILAARLIDEATWQGLVVLWNAASGKEINSFPEANGLVTGMAWSPDGQTLAWTDGWSIRLWDAASSNLLPKPQPTWPAPITGSSIGQSMVTNLAWSPDGKSLATSQGNIIKLWDPGTGKEIKALEAPEDTGVVTTMAWSSDGHMLADLTVIGNSTKAWVQIWDITTGQELTNFGNYGLGLHIAWAPSRNILAYSVLGNTEDGSRTELTLYNPTGEVLRTIDDLATDLAWSPSGRTLATANSLAGTITLWGIPTAPRPVVTVDIATPTARITTIPHPTANPPGTLGCGWSTVALPATGSVDSALSAIAAVSATDIWAVGSVTDADYSQRNLIEHWDGTRWTVVPGPNQEGRHMRQYLSGLAVVTGDDIWAVGGYSGGQKSPLSTAILHWDGRSWTSVPAPTPGKSNGLIRVAAVSKNDIWAVGAFSEVAYQGVYVDQPLIEHWDGKQWSVAQTPDVGRGWLAGIAVVSPGDVWAVGNDGSGGSGGALTMHWDGATWKDVPLPIGASGLNGAVAIARDDVWAVGQGEVLHWDGTQWSIVSPITNPANASGEGSFLNSVTATSKSDLWAAGQLVIHWSSTDNWMDQGWWETQVTPDSGARTAWDARVRLSDLVALSPNDVWVVGYRNDDHMQQLIMHYDGSLCVDLTGIPTPTPIPTSTVNTTPTGDYAQFKEPTSAGFDLSGSAGIRGGKEQYMFSATGALAGGRLEEKITQDVPSGQTPSGGPGVRVLDVVLADPKGYLKVSGDYTGADNKWYEVDLTEGWGGRHTLPGLLAKNFTGPNPAYAAALQTTKIGRENINGVATIKYSLDVDIQKLHELRGMPTTAWQGAFAEEEAASNKLTLYLWIGESDRYIHQEQLTLEAEASYTSSSEGSFGTKVPLGTLDLTTTITYRDFDVPVTITLPPDATPFSLDAASPPNSWHPGEPSSTGLMPGFPISLALIPINPFLVEEVPVSPTVAPTAKPATTPSAAPTQGCTPGWAVVNIPDPSAGLSTMNNLQAVAALSPNDVWVVGSAFVGRNATTGNGGVTMHWDGRQLTPVPGGGGDAIVAIATNDIWTIGGPSTLHWDGVRWSEGAVANPDDSNGVYLQDIAATSPSDVWVVGQYVRPNVGEIALIEHWDGTRWSVVSKPIIDSAIGAKASHLAAVAAISPKDVWAMGDYTNGEGRRQTLALHWNGVEWSVVASPNLPGENSIRAIEYMAGNDVWAVGSSYLDVLVPSILIMHWDGARWSTVPAPDAGPQPVMGGIAAVSTKDVWMVGSSYNSENGQSATVTLHWDGTEWKVVPTPNLLNSGKFDLNVNYLADIEALPLGDVWAVGVATNKAGREEFLVLRYRNAPCPTPGGP
jgi:WD40 repeat protein